MFKSHWSISCIVVVWDRARRGFTYIVQVKCIMYLHDGTSEYMYVHVHVCNLIMLYIHVHIHVIDFGTI